jgi:hypothetical protein
MASSNVNESTYLRLKANGNLNAGEAPEKNAHAIEVQELVQAP